MAPRCPARPPDQASALLNRFGAPAFLALAVASFSGLWRLGALVTDGPGMALYVRLSRDHLLADGRIPYWMTEMWAGSPMWGWPRHCRCSCWYRWPPR